MSEEIIHPPAPVAGAAVTVVAPARMRGGCVASLGLVENIWVSSSAAEASVIAMRVKASIAELSAISRVKLAMTASLRGSNFGPVVSSALASGSACLREPTHRRRPDRTNSPGL